MEINSRVRHFGLLVLLWDPVSAQFPDIVLAKHLVDRCDRQWKIV
jgi:hypothetical protein